MQDCVIETDLEILIPDTYINNTSERLQLYSRLDNIKDEEQLQKFSLEIKDRFGPIPPSVNELINSVRLRWYGERLGFEKLSLKGGKLRAYFVTNNDQYFNSDTFGLILTFVKAHSRQCKMRESAGKAMLLIENISSVDAAIELLHSMTHQTAKPASEILSR